MRGVAGVVGTLLVAALLLGGACSDETDEASPAGKAGSGGLGGQSGVAGVAGGGSGGAPVMGTGGGGSGSGGGGTAGQGPCTTDDACVADRGAGSLCVSGTCTKATGACEANVLVVVADGRTVDDPALAGACHFRLTGCRHPVGTPASAGWCVSKGLAEVAPVLATSAASWPASQATRDDRPAPSPPS
jgi:hypothetical protein